MSIIDGLADAERWIYTQTPDGTVETPRAGPSDRIQCGHLGHLMASSAEQREVDELKKEKNQKKEDDAAPDEMR